VSSAWKAPGFGLRTTWSVQNDAMPIVAIGKLVNEKRICGSRFSQQCRQKMNVYVLTTTDAYATFCAPLDKIRWPAFWSSRENACHMVGMHDDLVSKDKPCLLYFPNRAWSV
jgi:hypothetical protein